MLQGCVSYASEEDMQRGQAAELRALEDERKAARRSRGDARALEARLVQKEFDLRAKHREEADLLDASVLENGVQTLLSVQPSVTEEEIHVAAVEAKKKKANAKKEKRLAKETTRAGVKESIAQSAGPSARESELESIRHRLQAEGLVVQEMASDGHCLYRSVADQLARRPSSSSESVDFASLRRRAAQHMLDNAESFAPFLGCEALDDAYRSYCAKVASVDAAEWGGQLEISALCACLRRRIHVYSAQDVLRMGDEFEGDALRVSYHRHYYALGEHYNSLVDSAETTSR